VQSPRQHEVYTPVNPVAIPVIRFVWIVRHAVSSHIAGDVDGHPQIKPSSPIILLNAASGGRGRRWGGSLT
jgi:hypothetical protein